MNLILPQIVPLLNHFLARKDHNKTFEHVTKMDIYCLHINTAPLDDWTLSTWHKDPGKNILPSDLWKGIASSMCTGIQKIIAWCKSIVGLLFCCIQQHKTTYVNTSLTWVTNFCHFFDLSLKYCGHLISLESLTNLQTSWFCPLFSFSNNLIASIIALLCCPCPYIKKSDVRPNLYNQ